MRRLTAIVLVIALFTSPAFALFKIELSGGYAMVAMEDVNTEINDWSKNLEAPGLTVTKANINHAFYANLDIAFGLLPVLHVGPRVGLMFPEHGKITASGDYDFFGTPVTGKIEQSMESMLVPIMGGLSANIGLPGVPISFNIWTYAGYGLGFVSSTNKYTVELMGITSTNTMIIPYEGGCFALDAGAGVQFGIIPLVNAVINVGYRMAKVAEMKAAKDVTFEDTEKAKKGDVLKKIGKDEP
ncbi:MAG TPA: hypothetical protein ENN95_00200, partial [Deltaproteobacteria bacterium]|nr:hypothetical protein [Deltaproteobacteria bacterium]